MRFFLSLLFSFMFSAPGFATSKVKVVTSFSILADIVKHVGGKHVHIDNIVGPNEDAHVFNPTPEHSMMLAHGDLVVVNGLGFEGWIDRLIDASGFKGEVVVASAGVKALKASENPAGAQQSFTDDPHAWHSIPAVMKYVDNISLALQKADPEHKAVFKKNATSYKQRLRLLDEWVRDEFSKVDPAKRKVITAHDAFQYFAREYKIAFLAAQGVSTQAEASPDAVMKLIDLIRKEDIKMIFVENITNEKQMNIIRESTGARIGGTLYSDALSDADGPASDYISLMKHNVGLIIASMRD
jgi:zinc/manganese transport system substrate-binding protein